MSTVRMTVTVPLATKNAISTLAAEMGVSNSFATQHLLKIGLTAESVAFGGGKIVAHFSNGECRTLADKFGNFTQRSAELGHG